MKVIFLKDVKKTAKKYETKTVADGYALNFLIPNGIAEVAIAGNMKRIDVLKAEDGRQRAMLEEALMKELKKLEGAEVKLEAKANAKGNLFAAIHAIDISNAAKQQLGIAIHPELMHLSAQVKEAGEHMIEVKVQDKTAKFKLIVTPLE